MSRHNTQDYEDLFIYVSSCNEIVHISEGDGSNITEEDIEEGYVDYIYYDQYHMLSGFENIDGGLILLTEPFREKYSCVEECIPAVLEMAYGNTGIEYMILKGKE